MKRLYLHPMFRVLGPIALTLFIVWLAFATLQPLQFLSEQGSQVDESEAEAISEEDESEAEATSVVEEASSEEPAIISAPSTDSQERVLEGGQEFDIDLSITTPSGNAQIAYNGEEVTYTIAITPPNQNWNNNLNVWVNLSPGGKRYFEEPDQGFSILRDFHFKEQTEEQSFPNPLGGEVTVVVTRQLTLEIDSEKLHNLTGPLEVPFRAKLVGQSNNSVFNSQVFYSSGALSDESNEITTTVQIPIDSAGAPTLSSVATWFSEDFGGTLSQDWADFDLDGDLDLVLGSSAGAAIYKYDAGARRFDKIWDNYGLPDTQRVAYGVRWGDFAGNASPELVVVGASDEGTVDSNSVNRVYEFTDASPPFRALDTFTSTHQFVRVETADLDKDGDLDLVASTNSINADCPVRFYRNTGTSDLFKGSYVCLRDQASAHISLVDLNNDDELDLMLGLFESQSVGFLKGPLITDSTTDTITHRQPSQLADPILFLPYDFAWGDYDGDGYLDLAASYPLQREVRVYRNLEGSGFADPIPIRTSLFRTPLALDWGDFDGDGNLELVVNDSPPKFYEYYKNSNGTEGFDEVSALSLESENQNENQNRTDFGNDQLWAIDGIDQDGDGDLELAITNRDGPSSIFTLFAPRLERGMTSVGNGSNPSSQVAWGDANRDQWLDLVFAAGENDILSRLYINQGGKFLNTPLEFASGAGPHSLAFGNMSGKKKNADNNATLQEQSFQLEDYTLELAIGTAAATKIYESNNSDNLIEDLEGGTTALAWGDLNDDRVLDLLVGKTNGPLQVYLNDKDGKLSGPWELAETDKVLNIALADYNNDNYLDFAVANEDGLARVYRNNGAQNISEDDGETFVQTPSFTLVWNSPHANSTDVAWVDIDQDGDLDLTVAYDGDKNTIYQNGPGFVLESDSNPFWEAPEAKSTTSLAWADFDNDGDMDLAVGNDGQADQLYVNEGHTSDNVILQWLWKSEENYATTDVAWGDIDRDGDLELAVSTKDGQPNGYYINNYILPSHLSDDYIQTMPLPSNPSYLSIGRPKRNSASDSTDDAYLYSSPELLSGAQDSIVAIPYKVYDADGSRLESQSGSDEAGDQIVNIIFEYSLDGNEWKTATPASTTALPMQTSRLGQEGVFLWDAKEDKAVSDHARFRVRAVPGNDGREQQASTTAISPPFRVRGEDCTWLRGVEIKLEETQSSTFFKKYELKGSVIEGSGTMTFTWSLDGGFIGTGAVLEYFLFNGTYDIGLEVEGATGCLKDSDRTAKAVIENYPVGTGITPELIYLPIIRHSSTTVTQHAAEGLPSAVALPSQVSDLQGKTRGDSTTLTWQANPALEKIRGYRIYRAPLGTTAFELAGEVPADETEYLDQTECGYVYYVTAFNESGESEASKRTVALLACE